MFNIEEEDLEEESLEDKVFEKADYIGEVLTGERKIHLVLPKKENLKIKIKTKPVKPSRLKLFIESCKKSYKKYREMSLARLIGMCILALLSITVIAVICYLLTLLLTGLLKLGMIGYIIFLAAMCAIMITGVLLLVSRYNRK